jgi:hypothetical protein
MSLSHFTDIAAAPPIYFTKTIPAVFSRIENDRIPVAFSLDDKGGIDRSTLQSDVSARWDLEFHHVDDGDLFVENDNEAQPTYYTVTVSAKDRSGRRCKGSWLFIHDKTKPLHLAP